MDGFRLDLNSKGGGAERGAALVLVLVVLMTLTVLGIGMITSSMTNAALSRNFEIAVQAQNMADMGVKVAYREFINGGFLQTTHKDDMTAVQTGDSLLVTSLQNYSVDGDGNFVWEWDDSKGYDPLWDTDQSHGFKFRVYYTTANAFIIESEGWYGPIHKRTRSKGEIETMFQFSYFASRDMGEFVRGASQQIRGKVHANGNMYVRPTGATLWVNTSSFTATGFIIRSRDAWGRPDESGACQITKNNEDSGIWVEMEPGSPRGSEGVAYDSYHPDWDDQTLGARTKWGGVVRDVVPFKSPPPIQNLDPGQYYEQQATANGTVIDNASHSESWCTRVTNFFNYNEQRFQTIWNIDVAAMQAAGDFPVNGLIYCKVPVRLSNASEIQAKLMVASCRTVYTKGDINTVNKKGLSIMTRHRIYHLSGVFNDATSTNSKNQAAANTRINAALVDGAPTVDEYNWCDRDGDHRYDDCGRLIYDDWNNKTAAGFNNPDNNNDPWANCDDLVENWSGKTLTKYGSVVHMGASYDIMTTNLNNSGITDDELAWVRRTGYSPPTRVYMYDPDLATPGGQPPFTPLVGHLNSWEPY